MDLTSYTWTDQTKNAGPVEGHKWSSLLIGVEQQEFSDLEAVTGTFSKNHGMLEGIFNIKLKNRLPLDIVIERIVQTIIAFTKGLNVNPLAMRRALERLTNPLARSFMLNIIYN